MNRDAAEAIANKIREVWGGTGPTVAVWAEELIELDETSARAALNRLKRTADRAPSIARFFATYHEIRKEAGEDRPACLSCDGAGWVQASDFVQHGHTYSSSRRCEVCQGSGKANAWEPAA